MDATARFAQLVQRRPEALSPVLDEVALLIAAHAREPGDELNVDAYLRRLDDLASGCGRPSAQGVLDHLFNEEGFVGAADDYYNPRNSYLDEVLDRRRGIPITLSLVVIEVGRRVSVRFEPIGMPGHFLVRHDGVLFDAFEGGRHLTTAECVQRFHAIHGPGVPFDGSLLQPSAPHEIVARMLANLRQIHMSNNDSASLEWVLRLRSLLPSATVDDRVERAGVLAALGRLDAAADLLVEIAPSASDERAAVLRSKAAQLRARLN